MSADWLQKYQVGVLLVLILLTIWHWRAESSFLNYLRSHHEDVWRRLMPYPTWDRQGRNKRWRIQLRLSRFCWSRSEVKSLGDPMVTKLSRERIVRELVALVLVVALSAPRWPS